jgi:cyanobactin maturation PatA/PatG family protease
LPALWAKTLGHSAIKIAVLDGPVDHSHIAFKGANLQRIEPPGGSAAGGGVASQHGTHVASILFGQHDGPVIGVAPGCSGIVIPIFKDGHGGSLAPSSEIDLARAISLAVDAGAHVINISGGQLSDTGSAHPLLATVVADCVRRNVLIVAAAGNDGCRCLHVPGALPSVLAVGAMNASGDPVDFSNWGDRYQGQGVIALGEHVLGAKYGGGTVSYSGTSVAAPIVAGVAGLLLSLQLAQGRAPDPHAVQRAILTSALGCEHKEVPECRRLLMGRLNVSGALSQIIQGEGVGGMVDQTEHGIPIQSPNPDGGSIPYTSRTVGSGVRAAVCGTQAPEPTDNGEPPSSEDDDGQEVPNEDMAQSRLTHATRPQTTMPSQPAAGVVTALTPTAPGRGQRVEKPTVTWMSPSSRLYPSACACGGGAPPQLVYALGQIYFDFGTDARRDSLAQAMSGILGSSGNVDDPFDLLKYLDTNPWDSSAVIWVLMDEATPVYAIQPDGPYAPETYARVRQFFREQLEQGVERVSVPGFLGGKVRLYTGMEVPVIIPDLRGMFSWTTTALIEAVCGPEPPESAAAAKKEEHQRKAEDMRSFLDRVYYDIRNMGTDPRDRAMNYSATNAFNVQKIFERTIKDGMALDTIEVERSPICRQDSDCWDVKLIFFNPEKQFEVARKVFRFTVDVSDVVPVLVGDVRQWSMHSL